MATLVYLTLDPVTRRVEYVRAGHPPPLLRDPRGEVRALNGYAAVRIVMEPPVPTHMYGDRREHVERTASRA